uniref:Uncharacterized protein n=1 Tax=Pongo abelii TaxID=9601 RepID=A0A8I5T6J6_PONAB|nr:hypothetical protein [Pongo abelii]
MASCTKRGGLPEKHSSSKVSSHAQMIQKAVDFLDLTFNRPPEQILTSFDSFPVQSLGFSS